MKAKMKNSSAKKREGLAAGVIKGAAVGLVITVAAVLVLALAVKGTNMDDDTISAINQVIKIASVFAAALVAVKGASKNYLLAGALSGGLYVILGYLAFSLIEGSFGSIPLVLIDLAMGVVIGMIVSFIFGKLLKSDKKATTRSRKEAY